VRGRLAVLRSPKVKLAASVLLAVAIFWFLATRVDIEGARDALAAMTWLELLTIALVALWNLTTYWVLWVAVMPGLTYPKAAQLAESGTALTNTVPGGSGIGIGLMYTMLDSWGFSRDRATLAVLVSGIWNGFIKLGLPVVALAILVVEGDMGRARVTAAVVGLGLLAAAVTMLVLMLRSEAVAGKLSALAERTAGRMLALVHRPPPSGWQAATVRFRADARELLAGRWLLITASALLSHLSLWLVLLVTLRHVGIPDEVVSWAEVLSVFAFARLITMVRFTPGGAGMVEAVLIGGLVAAGGPAGQVTAAVLVFRALTWLLPVPLGAVTYLVWRRQSAATRSGAKHA
jgi:uncharacterized membrane protein YbhN (UPF0104 family)